MLTPNSSQDDVTLAKLVADLRAAGIRPGMMLTVHSSLSRLGHVVGGADTVVQALVQAVGPNGVLIFPSLTFEGSMTRFLRDHPVVDMNRCPISTGAIPRAASRHPLVERSTHPTHSVLTIGDANQRRLLLSGNQSGQGPCGTESPYFKAAQSGGFILLIGVSNTCNTTIHCAEELFAPYIFPGETFGVHTIDLDHNEHTIYVKGYPTGLRRRFNIINERLINDRIMLQYRIGFANLYVIDAKRMMSALEALLAEDPYLLVERVDA